MKNILSCFYKKKAVIPAKTKGENTNIQNPCVAYGKKPGFIYLIREREFLKTNENIYKIGKTINIKNRMPSYPKDSRLYLCFYCTTSIDELEKFIISLFDIKFKKRIDIGSEYYEGDVGIMINYLTQLLLNQPYCETLNLTDNEN
jgi:hypothetical protein